MRHGLVRSWVRRAAVKWAIRIALKKPPPKGPFSLSGEAARKNDYYGAYLEHKTGSMFAVREMKPEGVSGVGVSKKRGGTEASIPFRYFDQYSFRFRHWYKDYDYFFLPAHSFILRHYTKYAFFNRHINETCQYFYNKRSFAREDRTTVLKIILENTIKDHKYETSATGIMSAMYGLRWSLHPKADDLSSYYRYVLSSLVISGDLVQGKNTIAYRLAPKAIATLDKEEQETTRHNENTRIQRSMVLLTIVLAVAAILQVWPVIFPTPKKADDVPRGLVYPLDPPPFPKE
jgi:hypothetical protein